jgi:hypothetical protein
VPTPGAGSAAVRAGDSDPYRPTLPPGLQHFRFLDTAFGSPIYERLRALGHNNVFEVNFGLTHTPDRAKANMRAYMWATC